MKHGIHAKLIIFISAILLGSFNLYSCNLSSSDDSLIDSSRIGKIQICWNLANLQYIYKNILDTILSGDEDVSWKGKIIRLSSDEWLLAESSWIDSSRIWRISTNSKYFVTINGYRVGDYISKIKIQGDSIDYFEGEVQAFELKSKKINFCFTIESQYSNDFYKKSHIFKDRMDYFMAIDPNATIKTITISGSCK